MMITEEEKLKKGTERSLKLEILSLLNEPLTAKGVRGCHHISCVSSNLVWVSDWYNLILTNTKGDILCNKGDLYGSLFSGSHTVNSENRLIYINRGNSINISLKEKTETFIVTTDCEWKARCVYWSPFSRDLLVGMFKGGKIASAKITRYNQTGQLTQTVQYDQNTGLELFQKPNYITENNNGDIVVSDYDRSGAVVVTDFGGKHRFSYTGNPSGSGLEPRGICTDELSNILVCDKKTLKVQMINKDGQFLLYLLTESHEIEEPLSLSYDFNNHCLWVGSDNTNKLCVYKYKTKNEVLSSKTHISINDIATT